MPYRRLPNTDLARVRALNGALGKAKTLSPADLAFSQKLYQKLRYFTSNFEHTVVLLKQTKSRRKKATEVFMEKQRKAKLYISHFIQVLNLAVTRGEINKQAKEYYGLPIDKHTVPKLNTNQDILDWGDRIIKGENLRTQQGGGEIIYNPSIAVVKIHIMNLNEAYTQQTIFQNNYVRILEQLSVMRAEADDIILELWNEVEGTFDNLPPKIKRQKCQEYGIVYFLRRNEKNNNVQL